MALLDSTSFYYNGSELSLFDMRIGWFDGAEQEEIAATRQIIEGERNMIRRSPNQYGTVYDPLTFTFDIFKKNNTNISYEESRLVNKWLLSTDTYSQLRFNGEQDVTYYALCTEITDIVCGGFVVKRLTFQTNSPFAVAKTLSKSLNVGSSGLTVSIYNSSDNGDYFPTMEITGVSSNVSIENLTTGDSMQFDLSNISDKYIKIDGNHVRITGSDEKIIPLYRLGITDLRWIYLAPGSNQIRITGRCNFKISTNFERRVGIL